MFGRFRLYTLRGYTLDTRENKMSRKQFYNLEAERSALPADAPVDAVKAEFARRLQRAMIANNWNQSDLARRAAKFTAGKEFPRDNISKYIRGHVLPGPHHLEALARALGVKASDILPARGVPRAGAEHPAFDMRATGDGNVWLRINQAVSMTTATKIMQLMQTEGAHLPVARAVGR